MMHGNTSGDAQKRENLRRHVGVYARRGSLMTEKARLALGGAKAASRAASPSNLKAALGLGADHV